MRIFLLEAMGGSSTESVREDIFEDSGGGDGVVRSLKGKRCVVM